MIVHMELPVGLDALPWLNVRLGTENPLRSPALGAKSSQGNRGERPPRDPEVNLAKLPGDQVPK